METLVPVNVRLDYRSEGDALVGAWLAARAEADRRAIEAAAAADAARSAGRDLVDWLVPSGALLGRVYCLPIEGGMIEASRLSEGFSLTLRADEGGERG